MRTCPKCGDFYADAALTFCLADGTPLVDVDPSSERWSEGQRVVEEKGRALRRRVRRLKWRRILVTSTTILMTAVVIYVVAVNSVIYLKPEREEVAVAAEPTPTPESDITPTPDGDMTPTPTATPTSTPTPTPTPTPVHRIDGRVTSVDGPLRDVRVALDGGKSAYAVTDAEGRYTFKNLPAGRRYVVSLSRPLTEFQPPRRSFDDLKRDERGDFVALDRSEHQIGGRVTGAAGPLRDVRVVLDGGKSASTVTDADGRYTFEKLPAGRSYVVSPSRPQTEFDPPRRSFDNLTRDERADFLALGRRPPPPPPPTPTESGTPGLILPRRGTGLRAGARSRALRLGRESHSKARVVLD